MSDIMFEHLTKTYPNGFISVDDVTLKIQDGEFVVFHGPSGCGKSTILRMIGGLEDITSGKIYLGDELLNDILPRDRKLAMAFQNYLLYKYLNVYENIVLPVELDGDTPDMDYLKTVVSTLGLEEKLNSMPNNLSGGQQQRVSIARALISKPAVILADEPTGNLDSKTSGDVLSLLKLSGRKFNQTVVMITHNESIAQLADRIIRIEDGRIVE